MKILFITNYFHPVRGGVENHVYYLAKNLIKKGHYVEVWCSNSSRDNKIKAEEEIIDKIKVKRFKTLFKIGDFGVIFPGIFFKNKKFDIVHVHVYRHFHNFIPFFTKSKFILTPHWPNYPKEVRKPFVNFYINLFDKFLGKIILNKYNKILCITDLEKEWFVNKFKINKKKLVLLPDGIPASELKSKKTKHKGINVLCFGRQHKSKGFDQAIKIAKYFPNINFIIAGAKDQETENLKKMSKNLRNVKIITDISEKQKKELFSKSDIFMHPSHYEGFGIVILEAFANKLAVITSNKGGLPWVVGKAGLIFEDNNIKDLKNKLELLIKNNKLRIEYSKKGYERVRNFTWDKLALALEKIYSESST